MMNVRGFAFVAGGIYLILGLIGLFIPGLVVRPSDFPGGEDTVLRFGYLFGLFPVNTLLNVLHLAIGVWGLWAMRSVYRAKRYARSLAVVYGALAVMGLIPILNTFFGIIPLWGHDIWLHGLTALISAYFGWARHTAQIPFPA